MLYGCIKCQFECDCSIGDLFRPTTYEEALDFAGNLNKKLSESVDAFPFIVWLQQLASLIEAKPIIRVEIDDSYASKCVQLAGEYDTLDRKVSDMRKDPFVYNTPLGLKLKTFITLFASFRNKYNTELKELIVDIRIGRKDVSSLVKLMDRIESDKNFVFNPRRLGQWLAEKQKELCVIKRLTGEILSDSRKDRVLTFPDKKTLLARKMSKYPVVHSVQFVFTSLAQPETSLEEMKTQSANFDSSAAAADDGELAPFSGIKHC